VHGRATDPQAESRPVDQLRPKEQRNAILEEKPWAGPVGRREAWPRQPDVTEDELAPEKGRPTPSRFYALGREEEALHQSRATGHLHPGQVDAPEPRPNRHASHLDLALQRLLEV
jgi:hypothetical protein